MVKILLNPEAPSFYIDFDLLERVDRFLGIPGTKIL